MPDTLKTYGARGKVDPVRFLIGAAQGWGANPREETLYLNVVPERNDGEIIHRLTVGDVPVDGFWSISVYNKDGYFEPNALDAYSLNNITAEKVRGRHCHRAVRGMRGGGQLPGDAARLELHGPPLSAARGNTGWQLDILESRSGAMNRSNSLRSPWQ